MRETNLKRRVPVSDSIRDRFGDAIFIGQELFRINESLTLDSPGKLDSNHIDSEVSWGFFRTGF
jgi:hypothetical protein